MVTKPCRWRWPRRAGGSSGSCRGKQPRGARGSPSQMGAVPALCSGLLLWCLPRAGAQSRSTESPAPGTERGVGWEQGPSWCQHPLGHSCSWKGPSHSGLHTQHGESSWGIPPLLAGKGAAWVPQQLLAGVAWLPCSSGDWVSGDAVLPTLPLAVITCQQLL